MSTNFTAADRIDQIKEVVERPQFAAAMIACTLRGAGQEIPIDPNRLTVGPKGIHETTGSRVLSDHVCDLMHPHVAGGDYFHYTGRQGLAGIMQSGVLRLSQLSKRIGEHEIRGYAQQHDWTGFQGHYAEKLAEDLFYTSVTRTDAPNEAAMWNSEFADYGQGARLRLRIDVDRTRHHAELRAMRYLDGNQTLLNQINADLAAVEFPPFLPWTASKIGAFGLPDGYQGEYEHRLLFKHHPGAPVTRGKDGRWEFLEVPFGKDNVFAAVNLVAVEAGPLADLAEIETIVGASVLAGTPVRQAP
ncbi:hypothetical protein [Bradyrhizobium diazoefficiens]|nr:hypothetical protein XF15B_24170 [Bradyrhizobium diazoefficiens]